MAFGTGLDSQVGIAQETTYGTYVAPSRFYEFKSESITPNVRRTVPENVLGRGRVLLTSRIRSGVVGASGDIELDAVNRGQGLLFKQMFGEVATAQVGATTEYTHTFTPDNTSGKKDLGATVQIGRPQTDGTIQPFSYTGGKVTGWEMTAAIDEYLGITTSWEFTGQTTAQAIATPSYAVEPFPFTFLDASLSIGGSAVGTAKGFTLTWDEAMALERFYLGGTRGQPLANGMLAITGTIESEFNDMTAYNAWVAGTEVTDLVLTFTGETIPSEANPYKIVITIPSLTYTGDAPQVSGPDIVPQNTPFEASYNETDEVMTLVYHTDDVTP